MATTLRSVTFLYWIEKNTKQTNTTNKKLSKCQLVVVVYIEKFPNVRHDNNQLCMIMYGHAAKRRKIQKQNLKQKLFFFLAV